MRKRLVGKKVWQNVGQKSTWQKIGMMTVAVCLCFAGFAGIGCKNVAAENDVLPTEKIDLRQTEFELPAWPPENESSEIYPSLVRWEVSFFDGEKVVTREIAAGKTQFSLSEIAGVVSGVVAQPITQHGDEETAFFFPAGCVYPFERKLTWTDGWVASVADSVARQLVYGETLEIGEDADGEGDATDDGGNTEITLGTGDAKSVLSQFNWEKYVSTVRAKTIEDDYGKKLIYDPWANDCARFAAYIKNYSTKANSKLSTSDKNVMYLQNVIENIQYYRDNVNVVKWKSASATVSKGEFSAAGELYMKLSERTKKIGADKMPLAQYIPYQDAMYSEQNLWLPYQKNAYFFVSANEIIQLYYSSSSRTNLVIITPIDYNVLK